MTKLISKSDPQYFEVTSTELYDRHDYKVVLSNQQSFTFDNYADCFALWIRTPDELKGYVEVLDRKQKKGFK